MGRSAHETSAALGDPDVSMENEQLDEPAVGQQFRHWRLDQFVAMGFDSEQAAELADAPVDLEQARRLIALGCPLETASRILL